MPRPVRTKCNSPFQQLQPNNAQQNQGPSQVLHGEEADSPWGNTMQDQAPDASNAINQRSSTTQASVGAGAFKQEHQQSLGLRQDAQPAMVPMVPLLDLQTGPASTTSLIPIGTGGTGATTLTKPSQVGFSSAPPVESKLMNGLKTPAPTSQRHALIKQQKPCRPLRRTL